jgi:hypothetical protein
MPGLLENYSQWQQVNNPSFYGPAQQRQLPQAALFSKSRLISCLIPC